jgi:uncharacterized protein YbjT (DUF2867 family)
VDRESIGDGGQRIRGRDQSEGIRCRGLGGRRIAVGIELGDRVQLTLKGSVTSFVSRVFGLIMKQNFGVIVLGGTGQVGGAAVAELLSIPACREVVMVTRKAIAARSRVRNVVVDTGAADFGARTAALAREALREGPVSAVSCVGVGSGSMRWSEEELKRLELGVVGAFARGCHDGGIAQLCLLSAVGSTARSRFRYVRVMGMKEDTMRVIGFARLAIFRPGIIVGNAHTPVWVGWFGSLVPGRFGNIDQRILGRSIAAEIALHSQQTVEATCENAAMKRLSAQVETATKQPLTKH